MLADPAVTHGDGWLRVWSLLQTRPLTTLTFWANYQLGGANPMGFHLVNLLIHLCVVLLLFRLLREVMPEEVAFGAAALFAIHPLQSEAVAYIFARGTLLAAAFCLLSWHAWRNNKQAWAVGWFAVALLCKEECVAFPFVLMLFGPRHWKASAAMVGLAFVVGARTVYATSVVEHSGAGFSAGISPVAYLTAQGIVILRYIGMIVVPWGYTVDPTIPMPAVWIAIAAWVLIAAGAVLAVRYRPWIWFSAGILLLLPSSSILPAADLAADRRMYLPMIAFCVLIAWLARSRKWAGAVAAVLIVLSISRMETWKTERSLWEEAVYRSPDKARPRIQLARALPPAEALVTLQGAPQTPDVITELGRVYLDAAQPADALREFGRALALQPGNARAVNNRGVALLALGQKAAARKDFERALAMNPDLRDARDNLAKTDATAAK